MGQRVVLLNGQLLRLEPVNRDPLHVAIVEILSVSGAYKVQVCGVKNAGALRSAVEVVLLLESCRE